MCPTIELGKGQPRRSADLCLQHGRVQGTIIFPKYSGQYLYETIHSLFKLQKPSPLQKQTALSSLFNFFFYLVERLSVELSVAQFHFILFFEPNRINLMSPLPSHLNNGNNSYNLYSAYYARNTCKSC